MNIIYIVLLAVILFTILALSFLPFKKEVLYIFAIGSLINSNIFNGVDFPISIFGLNVGVDGIIYTLFLYCVFLSYFYYGKKTCMALTATAIISMVFSAIIQQVAYFGSKGFSLEYFFDFLTFVIGALATYLIVSFFVWFFEKIQKAKLSKILVITISILIANIAFSFIYYGFFAISQPAFIESFVSTWLGSIVARVFATLLSIFALWFNQVKNPQKIN